MDEDRKIELLFGNGAVVGDPFCLLIKSQAANIMVDCGLGAGHKGDGKSVPPPILAELNGARLDGVVVTHGHLDHVGDAPDLAGKNCGSIYMSEPTLDFGRMHWWDSQRIAIREWCAAQGKSVHDFYEESVGLTLGTFSWREVCALAEREGAELPFSNADIEAIESKVRIASADKGFMLGKAIVQPVNAGHILGALGYLIKLDGRRIFVSGDFSMQDTNYGLFASLSPAAVGPVDILVVNATYAGEKLETLADEKKRFIADMKTAMAQGRQVLIPVFAIDRAPKVYSTLREAGLERHILIAGQARKGFSIYHRHTQDFWGANRSFCDSEENVMVERRIANRDPVIYLATSGMMMEKTISHAYAGKLISGPNSLIATVGYMAPDTPGRKLVEAARAGANKVAWNGSEPQLRAEVKSYQFSAHARQSEIAALIKALEPKQVIFAHSEAERVKKFIREHPGLPGVSEESIPVNGKPIKPIIL